MNDQFIEELYKNYYVTLYRYCATQFHCDPAYMSLVDDIVQEVFIKAYKNQKALMNHSNKMGWLCITCKNMCRSIVRRDVRRKEIIGVSVPIETCNDYVQRLDDIMCWVESREDSEVLAALKETLTPTEMRVYEAYYEENQSDHETASVLGMTLVAVRGVLQRIRNKAKKHDFLTIFLLLHPIMDMWRTVVYEGRRW